ncbi:hypothetical protein SI65_05394 [Aspergillus cristatus]|uniref:BRCT domain-containing protein n=1 Tax=Aspergillus cristatus TaxID=573508 RepID=A0A1E3BCW4_ASPCR|nr:hypothetical protein SI65_05394 [Aspergillus cristatus]
MPFHTVILRDVASDSDKDQMRNLITMAGGKISRETGSRFTFEVPDQFDLRLITRNLDVETLSDHP